MAETLTAAPLTPSQRAETITGSTFNLFTLSEERIESYRATQPIAAPRIEWGGQLDARRGQESTL